MHGTANRVISDYELLQLKGQADQRLLFARDLKRRQDCLWAVMRGTLNLVNYPLVNFYITVENHLFSGKSTINGACSIAMLNYQRVKHH